MDDDPALEPAVRDLRDTLAELRSELREPPRGPLGLPRPPSPRELLQLTEQYTIPALLALLETNIRLLELLAAVIRVADGRPLDVATREEGVLDVGRRTVRTAGRAGSEGLAAASRATLERLDDALADLQDAAADGPTDDPEVDRLLSEARALRAAVDEHLAAAVSTDGPGDAPRGPADEQGTDTADDPPEASGDTGGPVTVDVEEELNTLRRQADRPTDTPDDPADDEDGPAGDGGSD